jgi:flavin-dependent dehydrogenase
MASSLNKRDHCDVAIIGGGLAGSLSAIHLSRAGFHVVLFEKTTSFTDKVCGEFLSYESLPLLREVGLDPIALGGIEITGFRLHGPTQTASLRLPRRAVGLSRSVLDEEMLRIAAEAGAEIRRGVRVTDVLEGLDDVASSILLSTTEGETRASRLIVATGKSEFRSLNERVGRDNSYVGFKMHVRLKPSAAAALGSSCDLMIYEGGYGGLTPLGNGVADLCFLIERSRLRGLATDWDSLSSYIGRSNWAASHLLDGAEPLAPSFTSIGVLPYGFLRRAPAPSGVFFVGDQMAVIPSLTGDGLAIALMTARRAVEAMIETGGEGGVARLRFAPHASRSYQRAARAALRPQLDAALTLHALFKNPRLVDVSTYALRAFPAIFQRLFRTTRCQFVESSWRTRLRSWQKSASLGEIVPRSGPVPSAD